MNQSAPVAYFLDTSALAPRFLRGAPGYEWINALCAPDRSRLIALAEITEVEIVSTLHQLARGGTIKRKRRDTALALFWNQVKQGHYTVIPIASAIITQAVALCERHPLKGYDAVQLACELSFREDIRAAHTTFGDPIFLSEDQRLLTAASAEGFAVDSPLAHMP